jgi:hypothetical protein
MRERLVFLEMGRNSLPIHLSIVSHTTDVHQLAFVAWFPTKFMKCLSALSNKAWSWTEMIAPKLNNGSHILAIWSWCFFELSSLLWTISDWRRVLEVERPRRPVL